MATVKADHKIPLQIITHVLHLYIIILYYTRVSQTVTIIQYNSYIVAQYALDREL